MLTPEQIEGEIRRFDQSDLRIRSDDALEAWLARAEIAVKDTTRLEDAMRGVAASGTMRQAEQIARDALGDDDALPHLEA